MNDLNLLVSHALSAVRDAQQSVREGDAATGDEAAPLLVNFADVMQGLIALAQTAPQTEDAFDYAQTAMLQNLAPNEEEADVQELDLSDTEQVDQEDGAAQMLVEEEEEAPPAQEQSPLAAAFAPLQETIASLLMLQVPASQADAAPQSSPVLAQVMQAAQRQALPTATLAQPPRTALGDAAQPGQLGSAQMPSSPSAQQVAALVDAQTAALPAGPAQAPAAPPALPLTPQIAVDAASKPAQQPSSAPPMNSDTALMAAAQLPSAAQAAEPMRVGAVSDDIAVQPAAPAQRMSAASDSAEIRHAAGAQPQDVAVATTPQPHHADVTDVAQTPQAPGISLGTAPQQNVDEAAPIVNTSRTQAQAAELVAAQAAPMDMKPPTQVTERTPKSDAPKVDAATAARTAAAAAQSQSARPSSTIAERQAARHMQSYQQAAGEQLPTTAAQPASVTPTVTNFVPAAPPPMPSSTDATAAHTVQLPAVALPDLPADLSNAMAAGAKRVRIEINPPSLGHVEVGVHMRDGAVFVSMQAENPQVAQHIERHLQDLRSHLKDAGLSLGGFEMSARGDEAGQQAPHSGTSSQERLWSDDMLQLATDNGTLEPEELPASVISQLRPGSINVIA